MFVTYIFSIPSTVMSQDPDTSKKFRFGHCINTVVSTSLFATYGRLSRFKWTDSFNTSVNSVKCFLFPEGSSWSHTPRIQNDYKIKRLHSYQQFAQ